MDNRLLIGFGGFLALFLVFPFLAQVMRDDGADGGTASGGTSGGAVQTTPASRIPDDPPELNAQNLVGTEWQVEWENYRIKITIAANGIAYATHPLMQSVTGMPYFEGRWRIEYDRVYVDARFGDDFFSEELIVSGTDLYARNGDKIQRF